ncbi:twin-arginine translocase TatA/TatE family subunit [bacterium]|nr:twin-arginine translocase TatA/TatE family subunit [bacterium]
MPFNLGPGELFLLAVVALLIFGPQKLPEIGRSLGEALGSLRKAYNDATSIDKLPETKTTDTSEKEE